MGLKREGGRPMRRYGVVVVLAAALTVLGGCASLPGSGNAAPMQTYTLAWQPDGSTSAGKGCHTLLISAVRSGPGFGGSAMVYVVKPQRLDHFANHRWTDSPARMLAPLLLRSTETSGLFRSVAAAPAPVRADLRLDSEVLALEQIFSGKQSRVRLVIRVELYDMTAQALAGSRVFTIEQPAPSNDPYGGVQAANEAVDQFMGQLRAFLAARLRQPRLQCGAEEPPSPSR